MSHTPVVVVHGGAGSNNNSNNYLPRMSHTPVVVVHGGAGSHALVIQDAVARANIEAGVKAAARAGYGVLQAGGSALDAVESAAVSLEDNPIFNAGRGSCLTKEGNVEMDACIMDGWLRAGGVGCIENVANPIKVARLVMEKSDHVLFVGEGAKRFAMAQGVQIVPTEALITEKARNRLLRYQTFNPSVKLDFNERTSSSSQVKDGSHDTVGAVAVDVHGHVAFATTTGGINAKQPGRCGDSAVPGCGGYSDNRVGAVSTTGHGESFLETNIARHITFHIEQGCPVQEAVEKSLAYTLERVGGCGGAIAVTPAGDIGVSFNTEGMSWASAKDGQLHFGIYTGENKQEPL